MFFTDDDMHESLKISLETLTNLTANSTDPDLKRKSAKNLAQIVLQIMRLQKDKEDWEFLLKPEDENDFMDDEDDNEMPF